MGWKEIYERVPSLPGYLEKGVWPYPDTTDFWIYADDDVINILFNDQIPKHLRRDISAMTAIARCYSWGNIEPETLSEERLQTIIEDGSLVDGLVENQALEALFTAHMRNYLYVIFDVQKEDYKSSWSEILDKYQNIREYLEQCSDSMKTVVWYSLWFELKNECRKDGLNYTEAVNLLTEGFGLNPPEII